MRHAWTWGKLRRLSSCRRCGKFSRKDFEITFVWDAFDFSRLSSALALEGEPMPVEGFHFALEAQQGFFHGQHLCRSKSENQLARIAALCSFPPGTRTSL